MWGLFSYLDTRVPAPNEQPFLHFVIFPPYFFLYLLLLNFSCILLYCSYSDVAIFDDVMMFEFNYFCKVNTSRYWFTTLYPFFSYIKQSPYFFFIVMLFFSMKFDFSYYITFCFCHFYFTSSFVWLLDDYFSQTIFNYSYICVYF